MPSLCYADTIAQFLTSIILDLKREKFLRYIHPFTRKLLAYCPRKCGYKQWKMLFLRVFSQVLQPNLLMLEILSFSSTLEKQLPPEANLLDWNANELEKKQPIALNCNPSSPKIKTKQKIFSYMNIKIGFSIFLIWENLSCIWQGML